jgi:hypothetical protein
MTYAQFKSATKTRLEAEYPGENIDSETLDLTATKQRWHKEVLEPLAQERKFTQAECRSIAKNGGGYSLWQYAKYFDALPKNVLAENGKVAQ